MNTRWINPEMQGSYVADLDYEDTEFSVSLGSVTGPKTFADPRIIIITFKRFDIDLIGDGGLRDAWINLRKNMTLFSSSDLKDFIFKALFQNLDHHWFMWLLNDSYTKGQVVGKLTLQMQLRNLLDVQGR